MLLFRCFEVMTVMSMALQILRLFRVVVMQMIDSFEKELASTVDELKQEKENSSGLVEKMRAEV